MYRARIGGLAAVLLAAPAALLADQPAKFVATVTMPEIEVRSGPAWNYPGTGKLKKGEQVFVHHEDVQFLAILPPAGTVSWVNHRFLGDIQGDASGPQNAIITAKSGVETHVGADVKSGPMPVRGVRMPFGGIVKIVGPKMRFDDSTWYPIQPPAGEYRYISRQAVGALEPAPQPPPAIARNPQEVPEGGNRVKPASAQQEPVSASQASTAPAHPSWAKAEAAEQAGDWADAERLYTQVYTDLRHKNADIDQLLACYNRIDRCRERGKSARSTQFAPPASTGNAGNVPATGGRPPAALSPPGLSEKPFDGDPLKPLILPETPRSAEPRSGKPAVVGEEPKSQSSGIGLLRKAPFFIDNRQAFALEGDGGKLLYYVTAQPGVNLDGSVNRQVELWGNPQVRGDIRGAQYMTVSRVLPLK